MKGFIGAANIDTNSRLCMASSVAGHRRAFGADTVPGTYEDLEEADLVVLVGSNLAWCHPVLYQRLAAAKAARPAMKVVTVDPRRTATTDLADLHLAPRARHRRRPLQRAPRRDRPPRRRRPPPTSPPTSRASTPPSPRAEATDPAVTGLAAADLAAFLDLWIGTEKVVTVFSQGVNQSASGTDKVNAIINCHLATGRIGRPGMGPFSVTGQPNAMGGREVGGLANMLAAHLDLENPTHRFLVKRFWDAPRLPEKPGLKAVDLFRACADGRDRGALDPRHQPRRLDARGRRRRRGARPRPARRRLRHVRDHRHRAARPRPAPRPRLGREVRHRHQLRAPHLPPAPLPRPPPARRRPDWWALAAGRPPPRPRRRVRLRRPRPRSSASTPRSPRSPPPRAATSTSPRSRRRLRRHAPGAMAGRRPAPASSPTAASSPPTAGAG